MMLNQKIKIIISSAIGTCILALLLYLSNINEMISLLGKIQPKWILFAVLVYNINWIVRGYRWQLILDSMNYKIEFKESIFLTIIGNFANLIAPAKMGDAFRAFMLKKKNSVSLSKGFSSIIIDRISDFFGVMVLVYLSLMMISKTLLLPDWTKLLITGGSYFLFVGFITFIILSKTEFLEKLLNSIRIVSIFSKKFVFPLFENIRMVYRTNVILKLGVSSVFLWILEAAIALILLYPLGYQINIFLVIFAIMIANLTKTLPLTPGGMGVYEGAVAAIFAVGGMSYTLGLTIGILEHGIKNLYTLIIGIFSLSYYGLRVSNLTDFKEDKK